MAEEHTTADDHATAGADARRRAQARETGLEHGALVAVRTHTRPRGRPRTPTPLTCQLTSDPAPSPGSDASNPLCRCAPSQNGRVFDWPHRQSATGVRVTG